jgi:hypothetical protein
MDGWKAELGFESPSPVPARAMIAMSTRTATAAIAAKSKATRRLFDRSLFTGVASLD